MKATVSELVKNNAPFLRQIHANGRSRKKVAKLVVDASDEQLLCLVEICLNILRGRAPLQKRHLQRLQKQAQLLRHFARVRSARSARRLVGKGIPAIAGILASVMMPLLTDVLMNKNK